MSDHPIVYLFVHAVWSVKQREPLLAKPVRRVLFAHMQKDAAEKGIRVVAVNGVEDHIHCVVQLMPSQNLIQVIRSLKTDSSRWLNENKLLSGPFEWEEGYFAYSISPSGLKQVSDYVDKQEEYHKTKTLENEWEAFERLKDSL